MSCKKASYIIEKRNLTKLNLMEKVSLKFHLAICHLCRKYEADSAALNRLLHSFNTHPSNLHLSDDQKLKLKERLDI